MENTNIIKNDFGTKSSGKWRKMMIINGKEELDTVNFCIVDFSWFVIGEWLLKNFRPKGQLLLPWRQDVIFFLDLYPEILSS